MLQNDLCRTAVTVNEKLKEYNSSVGDSILVSSTRNQGIFSLQKSLVKLLGIEKDTEKNDENKNKKVDNKNTIVTASSYNDKNKLNKNETDKNKFKKEFKDNKNKFGSKKVKFNMDFANSFKKNSHNKNKKDK